MSERKRAKVFSGDSYYNELLGFAESFPTKIPSEESAEVDSQLDELMTALRVANLEDNDVPLFTLLRTRGFNVVATYLLIALMVRRKKRRGRPEKGSILKLQAHALYEIKKQIRSSGIRARVHEKAMRILERGHNFSCEDAMSEWGLEFAPFDRDKLENHIRRSRVPRRKSGAK